MSDREHNGRDDDRLISKIVNAWPLIVALASVIVLATTVKNKVDSHEDRISKLENSMGQIQSDTSRLVNELLDNKK